MQYKALYRENRPEVFSEILGQDHIVRILRNQIATDTVSHAYLFCGTRGTGKTTTARILAKALNCTDESGAEKPCGHCPACKAISEGNFIDVIEIDAASNNGVDNIRELRESVKYPPNVGKKKIYIIDEVHMLSTSAFNALLKTLEEPPENVIFIMATTDPQKLPQTVLSRCMRLDFRRVTSDVIMGNMADICAKHGVEITDSALRLLAVNADGSVRDSLSLLEQCLSSGEKKLDRDTVLEFLGAVPEEFFLELTEKVLTHNVSDSLFMLDQALKEGKDVKQMMKDWMAHYRNLLITKFVNDPEDMLNMSTENIAQLKEQSSKIEIGELNHSIIVLAETINDARYSTQARILMEVAIVTLASGVSYVSEGSGVQTARVVPARTQSVQSMAKPKAEPAIEKEQAVASESVSSEKNVSVDDVRQSGQQSPSETSEDLEELWREVFEEAEAVKPSLNIMRKATLAELGKDEFKVIVDGEIFKSMLDRDSKTICEIMERRTGVKRRMVCRLQGQDIKVDKDSKLGEMAEKAADVLGLNVEIK